jgi:electron transfer flavoprotein beta subunit
MKIVVCVKQVPDTAQERRLDPADKTLDRAAVDGVLNELDEYAIEESLLLAEATDGDVTVLSMGPERATRLPDPTPARRHTRSSRLLAHSITTW